MNIALNRDMIWRCGTRDGMATHSWRKGGLLVPSERTATPPLWGGKRRENLTTFNVNLGRPPTQGNGYFGGVFGQKAFAPTKKPRRKGRGFREFI
jgi:hypothetical protein